MAVRWLTTTSLPVTAAVEDTRVCAESERAPTSVLFLLYTVFTVSKAPLPDAVVVAWIP